MRVHTSATRGLIPLLGAFALVSCTGSVPAPNAVIAGGAQTVNTGDFVQLDGSGSSDSQNRAIAFSWSFAKRPLGSQISLIDANSPRASFKADAPGEFVVELIVSNSLLVSAPARVTVTVADCGAHAPTVNAAATPSTTKPTGVVQLTATASDADNACGLTQTLTVRWTLDTRPQGSTALPTSNTLATISFTPDKPGNYEFSVIASDSTGRSSQPATVIVTATTCSEDLPGVGSISISSGGAKVMGTAITLQANNVTDTNCLSTGSPQLQWSLTVPSGSRAALDNVFGNTPTFLPDMPGAYVVSVTARNSVNKTSDAVFLTINVAACSPTAPQRPTILGISATQVDPDGGPLLGTSTNPIPHVGTTVTLIPDGIVTAYCGAIPTTPLTYTWTVTQRPAGSQAQLDSSVASSPTFTPDKVGHYQFAAVAKDAFGNSTASKTFDFDTSDCGTNPLAATISDAPGLLPFDDHTLTALPAVVPDPLVPAHKVFTLDDELAVCPSRFAGRYTFTWSVSSSAPVAGFVFDTLHGTQAKLSPGGNAVYDVKLAIDGSIAHADALTEVFVSCSDVVPKTGPIFVASSTVGYPAGTFFRDDTAKLSVAPSSLCLSPGSTAYSYLWSLGSRPAGSQSVLSSVTSATPTFLADVSSGTWTASVIVVDKLGNRSLPTTASFTSESCGINPILASINDISQGKAFDPHALSVVANGPNGKFSRDDDSTLCPTRFAQTYAYSWSVVPNAGQLPLTDFILNAPALATPADPKTADFAAGTSGSYDVSVRLTGSKQGTSTPHDSIAVNCSAPNPVVSVPAVTAVSDPDNYFKTGLYFRDDTISFSGAASSATCYSTGNFHPTFEWSLTSDDGAAVFSSSTNTASLIAHKSGGAYDVKLKVKDQWAHSSTKDLALVTELCGKNVVSVLVSAQHPVGQTQAFDPYTVTINASSVDDDITSCPGRFAQTYALSSTVTPPTGVTNFTPASSSATPFTLNIGDNGTFHIASSATGSKSGVIGNASTDVTVSCSNSSPTFTNETANPAIDIASVTPPSGDTFARAAGQFFRDDKVTLEAPASFACYSNDINSGLHYTWRLGKVDDGRAGLPPLNNATSAMPDFTADQPSRTYVVGVKVQDRWGHGGTNPETRTVTFTSGDCGGNAFTATLDVAAGKPRDVRQLTLQPASGSHFNKDDSTACPTRFAHTYDTIFSVTDSAPPSFTLTQLAIDHFKADFTAGSDFAYHLKADLLVAGIAVSSPTATIDGTCATPSSGPATIDKVNGVAFTTQAIFAYDSVDVKAGTVSSACLTSPALTYTWHARKPTNADGEFTAASTTSAVTIVPVSVATHYEVDYEVSDGVKTSATSAAASFDTSNCFNAAPALSIVKAEQGLSSISRLFLPSGITSDAGMVIEFPNPEDGGPAAADAGMGFVMLPFYLDSDIKLTVSVSDPADASCGSYTLTNAGLAGPTGSQAALTGFPDAGVTVASGGVVDFHFAPDIGMHSEGGGLIGADYFVHVDVTTPAHQRVANQATPPLVVAAVCGRNPPHADFDMQPPDGGVPVTVNLDGGTSFDPDNQQLVIDSSNVDAGTIVSGCGLIQTLTYTWTVTDPADAGVPLILPNGTTDAGQSFVATIPGPYNVDLVVDDGKLHGEAAKTFQATP